MHLISELSDHLEINITKEKQKMVNKKDLFLIESLLFLQAIDQCSGKRKASEALNTSIDTINKYIDFLEDELGVKLISTSGRGSNLTNIAQRIVSKVQNISEILDEIKSIKLENREIKGEVRVCISLGYASYMVPHDLSELFNIFPELKINSVSSTDILKINVRDFDIALSYEEINNFDICEISKKTIHCGFFASSNYLAEHGYPVDIDDLVKNHRLITKNNDVLESAIGSENFKKAHICFESNNILALINALENSSGVGILPLGFATQGLVCLDNIPCDCPICYHLYANRNTKDIPRVRTLVNFYKNIMDKMQNPIPLSDIGSTPIVELLKEK